MKLNKLKKKDLIHLIEEYEDTINLLEIELNSNCREKIIILDIKNDNKQLIYLKKKIKYLMNKTTQERYPYVTELNRLITLYG